MKTHFSPLVTVVLVLIAIAAIGGILWKSTYGAEPTATKAGINKGSEGMNLTKMTPEKLKQALKEEDAKKKQ